MTSYRSGALALCTALIAGAVMPACSGEASARKSFEACGRTLSVVSGAAVYNWGDRYGNTDGHEVHDVVPIGDTPTPMSLNQVVSGYDQLVVSDLDLTSGESVKLMTTDSACSVFVSLVVGDEVGESYPSAEYPWVVAFSE